MDTPTTTRRLDEVMEVACRLAGSDAIGSIHVALQERPTYDQVLHYRGLAACYGLSLTLTADRVILRSLPVSERAETFAPSGRDTPHRATEPLASGRRWLVVKHWWHALAIRSVGFPGFRESNG